MKYLEIRRPTSLSELTELNCSVEGVADSSSLRIGVIERVLS